MAVSFDFLKGEMEKFQEVIKSEKEALLEEMGIKSEEVEKDIERLQNQKKILKT